MYFKQFFDERLAQYAYLIGCQANGTAVIIDPMRDIDQYIDAAAKENLTITAAADTHIHADYISGLREFAERGVKVYASDEGDKDWKYEWLKNSSYNYEFMNDGDEFKVGNITIRAWHTPGHTPEHLSFFVTDGAAADEPMGVATGDFVFVGDVGRPDLLESAAGQENVMEPSARTLFKTVESFKNVPEYVQVWPGHGAGSACGKALGAIPKTTVGYELKYNNSLKAATSEDSFVKFILEGQPEPPLYFARMKRDNKIGPAVIGGPPKARRLTIKEMKEITGKKDTVILDTRERAEFYEGHVPGSLLSPLNKQFNTIAGSYITEEEKIILLVDEHQVEEAILDLYRIGLDNVIGYVTLKDLQNYKDQEGKIETIETVNFSDISQKESDDVILDVRKLSEYSEFNIDGSVNIAHTRLLPNMEKLSRDHKHYVHCQSGGRSAVAAALLKRNGFNVVVIDDEIEKYKKNATV